MTTTELRDQIHSYLQEAIDLIGGKKASAAKYDGNEPLQLILYGAPGTGKSYTIDCSTDDDNSVRTTFHPDSDYATFVGSYKPTMENLPVSYISDGKVKYAKGAKNEGVDPHPGTESKIVYKYVPQAFLKAYVKAWKELNKPFYLIIEEINRGNCAQIFGDLFQLLDRNNSGSSSYPIHADQDIAKFLREDNDGFAGFAETERDAISKFELIKDNGARKHIGPKILNGELLLLPPNLRIRATMNTSDQSLFPIDSAFKRRWNWEYIPITYSPLDAISQKPLNWKFQIGGNLYSWGAFLSIINPEIYTLTDSSDKKMGYFFAKADPTTCIIPENVFLNKVLFYLWTDVFKDYDVASKLFNNPEKNRPFIFTDFFEDENALQNFIDNFDMECESVEENQKSTDINPRLSVKFPDGTIINLGKMTDIYISTLVKIGLDKVMQTWSDEKRGKYPLISRENIAIENPKSKRRYKLVDDYYVLVGPDVYPYKKVLDSLSEQLSLSLNVNLKK